MLENGRHRNTWDAREGELLREAGWEGMRQIVIVICSVVMIVCTGARKLLEQYLNAGDGLPSTPNVNLGPSPGPAPSIRSGQQQCMDVKTGQVVTCTTPPTALIIVAGMACMTFLITIALLLLFFSFVKQRRRERQRRVEAQDQQRSSQMGGLNSTFCSNRSVPPESSEYDSAVLVQLPGEVKPNLFAVPMPFLESSSATDSETVGQNELGKDDDDDDKKKDTSEARAEQQETESIDETPCVIAPGASSYNNPLFAPG